MRNSEGVVVGGGGEGSKRESGSERRRRTGFHAAKREDLNGRPGGRPAEQWGKGVGNDRQQEKETHRHQFIIYFSYSLFHIFFSYRWDSTRVEQFVKHCVW